MAQGKVRVVPLQEAHLDEVVEIEGTKGGGARTLQEVARLPKQHNVRVATVDDVPRGYLAWRDESPGVAVLEELVVHAQHRRGGLATTLLEAMRAEAKKLGLPQVIVRAPATKEAQAFLKRSGFAAIDAKSPERVDGWRQEQTSSGEPLAGAGQAALWADV